MYTIHHTHCKLTAYHILHNKSKQKRHNKSTKASDKFERKKSTNYINEMTDV